MKTHLNQVNRFFIDLLYRIKEANYFTEKSKLNEFLHDPIYLLEYGLGIYRNLDTCAVWAFVSKDWNGTLGFGYMGDESGKGICNYKSNIVVTNNIYGNEVSFKLHQMTMIHEIGHNLGADHDFEKDCDNCNETEKKDCSADKLLIMSPRMKNLLKKENFRFSRCSIQAIRRIIHLNRRRHCLKGKYKFIFC